MHRDLARQGSALLRRGAVGCPGDSRAHPRTGSGAEFDELIVTVPDAVRVAAQIRDVLDVERVGVPEHEVRFRSGDGTVLTGTVTVPAGAEGGPRR